MHLNTVQYSTVQYSPPGEEARHLSEARQEAARLEEERTARLAEVAAVEADLELLSVVLGQGEKALQDTEHRAVKRYLVFCRERERVDILRSQLGLPVVEPLGEEEAELQELASRLGVELGQEQRDGCRRSRSRLCSFCEMKIHRNSPHCKHCKAR